MTDHAGLRRLAEAATSGPWYAYRMQDGPEGLTAITDGVLDVIGSALMPDDAQFIAATNPAVVLSLLDEIDRAENGTRATAVREAAAYIERISRNGLVPLARILADLEAVAERMDQGMTATGYIRTTYQTGETSE